MGFLRKAGGVWAEAPVYRKAAGAWAPAPMWKKVAGVWTLISGTVTPTPSTPNTSKLGTTATVTSDAVSVAVTGGTAPYSYAWAKQSGGTITAGSPTAASTTFAGATMTVAEGARTAIFRCTVTDANGITGFCDVTVTLQRVAAPTVTLDKSTLSSIDNTTSETSGVVTATGAGGTAPYSYSWARVSGAANASTTGIVVTSGSAAATTFSASSLAAGESRSAVWRCTVTDANGFTGTADVTVTISRAATLTASVTPTSVSGSGSTASITTSGQATASASGGSGPFSYSWTKVSGGTITAVSATASATTFRATGMANGESRTATFKCTITDNVGQTATTANVTITITNTASTATYTPAAGTYNAADIASVSYSVSCSATATWTWSATYSSTGFSASIASGGSGTSITFTLNAALHADRISTVTLQSGGKTWTINLTAQSDPAGSTTFR